MRSRSRSRIVCALSPVSAARYSWLSKAFSRRARIQLPKFPAPCSGQAQRQGSARSTTIRLPTVISGRFWRANSCR